MKPIVAGLFVIVFAIAAEAQSPMEKQLLDLVNKERAKEKLSKLEWNDKLAEAARAHSRLLVQHQDLSHQFAGEPALQQRVGATGVRFDSVAENVGEGQDVATVHDYLMHSPGHRANILNPNYNAIGISIAQHGSQIFVTEDFAHIPASYTEKQFQDAVVSKVNKARRATKLPSLDIISDPQLHRAACVQDMNTDRAIRGLPGAARLVIYTQSDPGALPDELRAAIADRKVRRMNIGVCFETGGKNGFSHFWVVAAFYPEAVESRP